MEEHNNHDESISSEKRDDIDLSLNGQTETATWTKSWTGLDIWFENHYWLYFTDNRRQDWEAVDELLCGPCFSRTWVVQEVWKATDAIAQCGSTILRWKTFELAMSYIETWDDMRIIKDGNLRAEKWLELK